MLLDFTSAFDLVDDKPADAEKLLVEKRETAAKAKAKAEPEAASRSEQPEEPEKIQSVPESVIERSKPKLPKKAPKKEKGRPELQQVSKEHRQNLTLNVLVENERKFNEPFFKLRLRGDERKKQDLADQVLELIFDGI